MSNYNPRRKNKRSNKCPDYSTLNFWRRFRVGLGADHDDGHRGSAEDIREVKTLDRRQKRRRANDAVRQELKNNP